MTAERRAWLSLGSSLGDRAGMILAARDLIAARPGIVAGALSSLHETAPWGDEDQPHFLNAALAVRTIHGPHQLLDATQAVEIELGRAPSRRWGPRSIDIDIIHMEGVSLADGRLTLPHPHWRERAFVLLPLVEIEPTLVIEGVEVAGLFGAGPSQT